MTVHTVSENNPTYVTGADQYRIPFTGLLTPAHRHFEVMQEFVLPEHRRTEGYGLAFLESEEHSVTYIGSPRQIEEYQAADDNGPAVLDASQGVAYAFWPSGPGWEEYIPATTWNPSGEGIVTEFEHPAGGRVTVYEYLLETGSTRTRMIGLHCEQCHNDPARDSDTGFPNSGPQERRWMARNARVHVRRPDQKCRPADPRVMEIVTAVANDIYNRNNPVVTWESQCAASGPCAQLRHLRART